MGSLQHLVDAPAVVAVAAMFASRCTGELGQESQAYVMRTLPPALYERLVRHPDAGFLNVMPALPGRRRPVYEDKGLLALRTSDVGYRALLDAVVRRDGEIQHSMVMRELTVAGQRVIGSAVDMLPSILRDRFKLVSEADDLVHTWLRVAQPDPGRLKRMTWEQAVRAAAEWEAAGEAAQGDIRVRSHDGWHWRRLYSVRSLEREGLSLRHCVGNGSYDDEAQVPVAEGGFWSLREADGKSVMTLRLGFGGDDTLEICSFLGLCNREAGADDIRHLPALREYYGGLGVKLVPDTLTAEEETELETVEIDGHTVQAWDVRHHDERGLFRTEHNTVDMTARREQTARAIAEDRARRNEEVLQAVDELGQTAIQAASYVVRCGEAFFRALQENPAVKEAARGVAEFVQSIDAVERPPTRAERAAARPHWQRLNDRHQRRIR